MTKILTTAEIKARLVGRAPEPFKAGRRLELIMDTGRLVRGVVLKAGRGVAQVQVGTIPPWRDAEGNTRPGYPHIALVVYDQVRRWREPADDAPDGNWNPGQRGYATAKNQSTGEWHEWKTR